MARRPGYLRLRTRPNDRRIVGLGIRWWHPGFLGVVWRAGLRKLRLLPKLCDHCGGAGRLVKSQLFRRERCPVCRGTGRQRRRVA